MLYLSDSFSLGRGSGCLECTCEVLNINRGYNQALMDKWRRLWEYSELTSEIEGNIRVGMGREDAVHTAIDACIKKGILTDVLLEEKGEVMHMLLTEYDEKKHLRNTFEEGRREGLCLYIVENTYAQILLRYHFQEDDSVRIQALAKELLQAAEPAVYFAYKNAEEKQLAVLVTLGAGVDELQEEYTAAGHLTESYMIECIAMELLQNAYEQAAERIYDYYGLWLGRFDFLGDAVPIEEMEELFAILNPAEISYNQAYMLTPRKTVAFYTTMTDSRKAAYCNLCSTCSHTRCVHRKGNHTYGYQRIFGEHRTEGK